MRCRLFALFYILVCILAAGAAHGQAKLDAESISQVNTKVADFMAKTGAPGISIAVVKDGALVWSNGYGVADVENGVPATAETMYRLASVSKAISATGAMWLAEHGKLDLDAPVQKYCPAFPKKPWPITTREVLAHTAGIRHYKSNSPDDADVSSTRQFKSMEEALKLFANEDLLSEPGKKFHYSTFGYTLLGCVMEGASGQKYMEFMRQTIFVPSGMELTQDDDVHRLIRHRAQGYQKRKSGEIANSDLADTSYKIPGGGLISNAEEMARFEAALLNNMLLRPETRNRMWTTQTNQPTKKDPQRGYALGWGHSTWSGLATIGHAGAQQRVSTAIIMQPDSKAGAVVLCNLEEVDVYELAAELLKVATGTSSQ
ncbi:MAG TPA: serine hydrolase domain-containing protein [Candidatus Angelobacter sp.]|nr:serine hydrolase domain-containing protein [Candidatus Angelobacter sp.]